MLGRWCSWMRCGDEVYVVEGKRKVLLTMCRSVDCVIWFCERRKGEEYCVWFEFVEEFLVVVHESSYMDLFSYCELWDLIRFWYRVENAWWLFSNVVSLTWLRNMMMGTKELEILTDTRFQRWNFCSNCLVFFHFECFFLRLLIFFFTKTSIRQ